MQAVLPQQRLIGMPMTVRQRHQVGKIHAVFFWPLIQLTRVSQNESNVALKLEIPPK
jgi:hypothetical protein